MLLIVRATRSLLSHQLQARASKQRDPDQERRGGGGLGTNRNTDR